MASLDMFLITSIGRTIMGLMAALMLGFVGYLVWSVSFPPLAGLTFQTFTVVNSMASVVILGTAGAWFKFQAEWRTRFIGWALIVFGALLGGWVGYKIGYDRGVAELIKVYGHIPGGEFRVPTNSGIQWSLMLGAVMANVMALGYHVWRLLRYDDPGDF
jgi:hypothetical protein